MILITKLTFNVMGVFNLHKVGRDKNPHVAELSDF